MKVEDQLLEKQSELMKIIAAADDFISKLEQFSKILTDKEKAIFDKYELFHLTRFSFWGIAILETCKLFNPNEKYGLHKILNIAINNYSSITWKIPIHKNDLIHLLSLIDQQKDLFERLKKIRDNLVAHLDEKNYRDPMEISELRSLVVLSQRIYNKINLGLNGSDMSWDFQSNTMDMMAIRNLAKFEELRKYINLSDFKRDKLIPTEDLINILLNDPDEK